MTVSQYLRKQSLRISFLLATPCLSNQRKASFQRKQTILIVLVS